MGILANEGDRVRLKYADTTALNAEVRKESLPDAHRYASQILATQSESSESSSRIR